MSESDNLSIWNEATATLAPNLAEHISGLTAILEKSDLKLAKVLTGRSDSRSTNEEDARALEKVILETLARKSSTSEKEIEQSVFNQTRNTVVAWLRIIYVAIKWFRSRGHELATTYLPVIPSPEASPFSPHRVAKIAIVTQWREALFKSIKTECHKQNTEDATVSIALSSILLGCLLDQKKVRMLINNLHRPIEVAGSLTFVDFSLPYLGTPDAQLQRWFVDPFTELLLASALLPDSPTNIDNPSLIKSINKFLNKNGCAKAACPTSLSVLIDGASIYWESTATRIDIKFMRQHILSHSLTHKTWLRINQCIEPATQQNNSVGTMRVIADEQPSDDNANDANNFIEDSVAGIDWYRQISQAITTGQPDEVKSKVAALLVQHSDDAAATYLGWLNHLLSGSSSSGTKLAESTIFRQFSLVTSLMIALIGEENPSQWSLDDLMATYQSLLIDYEGKRDKSLLSKGLREFQHFLSKNNKQLRLKETRDLLGDEAVLAPVEARIITLDEYESTKALLESKALTLNHERVNAALLMLILIFRLGLRRSEAAKLLLIDFHMNGSPVLLIRSHAERRLKTHNSKRSIPLRHFLSLEEMRFLREFLARRIQQESSAPFSPYVFALPGLKRELISVETTTDLLHACLREITRDQTLHLHHLRHSFGTWTYLKLRAPDHPNLRELFAHLPHTYQYLGQGKRLRVLLLGSGIHPVRGYAFAVARLLGHSGPNISMEHYLHCSDLVVWADTVRNFIATVDKGAVVAASSLSQASTYAYLAKDVCLLMAAVRKNNSRYLVYSAIRPSANPTKQSRGRPKSKLAIPQTAIRIELKTVWSILHLAAQNKPATEIANCMGLSVNRVQPIIALAELHQEKIGLKPKSPHKITCPAWPRILGDKQFFADIEQRLIKLADTNLVLFEKGIELYLSRYNIKQGDVIFKNLNELNNAKEHMQFIRALGYPDHQIRLIVRSSTTGAHSLADWQNHLGLQQANIKFIPADFSNHPAYGKWLGIQLLDLKGQGHHKALALAIYLSSLA